jgi:hypothetical protein
MAIVVHDFWPWHEAQLATFQTKSAIGMRLIQLDEQAKEAQAIQAAIAPKPCNLPQPCTSSFEVKPSQDAAVASALDLAWHAALRAIDPKAAARKQQSKAKQVVGAIVQSCELLPAKDSDPCWGHWRERKRTFTDPALAWQYAAQLDAKGVWCCVHKDGATFTPGGFACPTEVSMPLQLMCGCAGNVRGELLAEDKARLLQCIASYDGLGLVLDRVHFLKDLRPSEWQDETEQAASEQAMISAANKLCISLNARALYLLEHGEKVLIATRGRALQALPPLPLDGKPSKKPVMKRAGSSHSTKKRTWPYMRVKG